MTGSNLLPPAGLIGHTKDVLMALLHLDETEIDALLKEGVTRYGNGKYQASGQPSGE
jgi:hypothetical protein